MQFTGTIFSENLCTIENSPILILGGQFINITVRYDVPTWDFYWCPSYECSTRGTISKLAMAIHIHTKAMQRERTLWWYFFFVNEKWSFYELIKVRLQVWLWRIGCPGFKRRKKEEIWWRTLFRFYVLSSCIKNRMWQATCDRQ